MFGPSLQVKGQRLPSRRVLFAVVAGIRLQFRRFGKYQTAVASHPPGNEGWAAKAGLLVYRCFLRLVAPGVFPRDGRWRAGLMREIRGIEYLAYLALAVARHF